jgi:hypothetical protein
MRLLEPFSPGLATAHARLLWTNAQYDTLIALAKTLRPLDRARALAAGYAALGRYSGAADALLESPQQVAGFAAAQRFDDSQSASKVLRMAPGKLTAPDAPKIRETLDFVFLYVGLPERVMDDLEGRITLGHFSPGNFSRVWHPDFAPVHKMERFKTYVRAAGLVDYWRAKGWPDLCHPTTGDDFACN